MLQQTDETQREQSLLRARSALAQADAILVAAGAGLSVPAGVNYYDTEFFARHVPAMVARGFSFAYQLIGHPALGRNPRLRWGYLISWANTIKNLVPPHPIYQTLRRLLGDKPYFVLTSNVDCMFLKPEHGFDPARVFTPQGSWRFIQCMKPCRDDAVFDSQPYMDRLLPFVDPATQEIPQEMIPRCPHCGADMTFNVNGGPFYRDTGYTAEKVAYYRDFLPDWTTGSASSSGGKKLVILEIGVGFNTPGVIRVPMEALAARFPNVTLIRINSDEEHAEIDSRVPRERAIPVAWGVENSLEALFSLRT